MDPSYGPIASGELDLESCSVLDLTGCPTQELEAFLLGTPSCGAICRAPRETRIWPWMAVCVAALRQAARSPGVGTHLCRLRRRPGDSFRVDLKLSCCGTRDLSHHA
jgi:hypothetical protein